MLKQHIIQHYLDGNQIDSIIPQHHGKAAELMIKYGVIAGGVRLLYSTMNAIMTYEHIASWISLICLLATFAMFSYHFMIIYLDSIVITHQGIIIMDQVGLLDFSHTRFDRDSIQTISYRQHGFVDRLLNKGDITIGIEHGTDYILPNVVQPQKRVDRLNHYKYDAMMERAKQIALAQDEVSDNGGQQDKFELLVDKLSDIIVDYMKQPRAAEVIEGEDIVTELEDDYPELYHKNS